MTVWHGRWYKYYGLKNRKLEELVFMLLFYIGRLCKTVELLTQRKRRRKLCKYLGMNVADEKGDPRWNSAIVNKPGQRRGTLVETMRRSPEHLVQNPRVWMRDTT